MQNGVCGHVLGPGAGCAGHVLGPGAGCAGHVLGPGAGCAGHAVYAKTGCTVDVYTSKGFMKILMRNVERLRGEACGGLAGPAEIERATGARGTTEAGAFGQRGRRRSY